MANSFNKDEYIVVYKALTEQMLSANGLFERVLNKFKEDFDTGGLTNEQSALAKSQLYASVYQTIESEAGKNSISILKSGADEASVLENINLTKAKKALVDRERRGFDDNLRIKKAEYNGNVASFAINANSDSAQSALTRFDSSIEAITAGNSSGGSFGEIFIDDIHSNDTIITGNVVSEFDAYGDTFQIIANGVTYIAVLNAIGGFNVTVDSANLIAGQSVTANLTITDSNGVSVLLTQSKEIV